MKPADRWGRWLKGAGLLVLGVRCALADVTTIYQEDFDSWTNGVAIETQDPTHWTDWAWTGDHAPVVYVGGVHTNVLDMWWQNINLYLPARLFEGVSPATTNADEATHMQISVDVWQDENSQFDFLLADYDDPPDDFDYYNHPGAGFEISGTDGYGPAGANGFYGAAGPYGNILTFISFGSFWGPGFDYFHKDYDPGVTSGAWHRVMIDLRLIPESIDAYGDMPIYTKWMLDGANLFVGGYPNPECSYTGVPVTGSESNDVWPGAYSLINSNDVWGTGGVYSVELLGYNGSQLYVDNIVVNQGNHLDIEQEVLTTCVDQTNAWLNLTAASYWGPSGVTWTSTPPGLVGIDVSATNVYVFNPSASTPGAYLVRAWANDQTNCHDSATVNVLKVEMKSVIFTSDHGVLTDYTNDFAGAGGTVFNPRGWTASGTNNPISQTKDTKLTADVTLCVQPSGMTYDLTGDGFLGYYTFHTNGLTSSGSDQTFSLTADDELPAQVDVLSHGINWSINVGGVTCTATSSGPHKVYVTWGAPTGTEPTLKRMDWTANLARPSTTLDQMADAIGPDAVGGARFGGNSIFGSPPTLSTAWQVMDGDNGDCGSLSTLMRYELDMLGATGAVVRFVYPRHASWTGLSQPSPPYTSYSETNSAGSKLFMWFAGGSGAGGNVYEGCCEFLSKWWMGGNGFATNSAYDVLIYCTAPNTDGTSNSHQYWQSNITNAVAYPPGTP